MKTNRIFLALVVVVFLGCEKQDSLGYEEFYEIYAADDILLTSDRDVFIVGEHPIQFVPQARNELNRVLPALKPLMVVEGDTLDSYFYTPQSSGQLKAFAVLPNGLKSNTITINSITEEDVDRISLKYDGVPYLTTNPWSLVRGFEQRIKLKSGREFTLGNDVYPLQSEGMELSISKDYIDQAGVYDVYFNLGSLKSNTVRIEVREEQTYEQVELPVVYHFINTSGLISGINNSVSEVNRLFNEPRLSLEENSNKVKTYVSLTLATVDPQGRALPQPGVHIISDGNGETSLDQLNTITRNNYWDPNKYINIYVTRGDYSAITGGEFNPGGWANFAPILKEGLPGMFTLDEEPEEPFYNAVHLNASLDASLIAHELGHLFSLWHNFDTGCSSTHGDYIYDTYHYKRTFNGDENCFGYTSLRKSNIMDYGGSGTIFTYDQRERLQLMMEHGLFIPNPKNRQKAREFQPRDSYIPIQVTESIY